MRIQSSPTFWLLWVVSTISLMGTTTLAAADLKLETILIWGTNDPNPSDPKLKPISPDLEKKLKNSPFKWKYYFEVSSKKFSVPLKGEKKEAMSKQCEIRIKNLGNNRIEIELFGKGKSVEKRTQALPKGEMLLLGGNAEHSTCWFVVLKQVD